MTCRPFWPGLTGNKLHLGVLDKFRRFGLKAPVKAGKGQGVQVPYKVKDSDPPWPRVMRRPLARGAASVDRGHAGMVIELRNNRSRCRPCSPTGNATSYVALSRVAARTCGVREPEHVCKLFARKPGDPRSDQSISVIGPVEEGLWSIAQRVREWEVGRGNIICEASEQ